MESNEYITIDIEIKYTNQKNYGDIQIEGNQELDSFQSSTSYKILSNKIKGTFIEKQLNKNKGKNYIKMSLQSKQNIITIDSLIDCLELINDPSYDILYTKDNMISYLFAFTICEMNDKKNDLLNKLLYELGESGITYFIQIISTLNETKLKNYVYYLIKHIINKMNGFSGIKYETYDYDNIVQFSISSYLNINLNPFSNPPFTFEDNKIVYNTGNGLTKANLNFIQGINEKLNESLLKFYTYNNYFNTGKILRRKSDESLLTGDDYPHYYELTLENDESITLFAIRESENSNFIISTNINDFSKYGPYYLGEIEVNYWGTLFNIYDNGYEDSIYNKIPKLIFKKRRFLGKIIYETNIMGDYPRFFNIDVVKEDNSFIHLINMKPRWNSKMGCYTLNFYGRVKKASAKNFQIIEKDDEDNILLQHGKVSKNEFNIDFRKPFSPIFAFAISLAAIGKKRVVS